MEIIFVLHVEAKHRLGTPSGQELRDPSLTERGRRAAAMLRKSEPLTESDALITGPTNFMLQTAQIWSQGTDCARFVHPLAGPRQFPFRYDFQTPPCDMPMEPERIMANFPELLLAGGLPEHLWLQGIDTLPGMLFSQLVERFLLWCRSLEKNRVFIVTGEGTLKAYREHLQHTLEGNLYRFPQSV
ncbi:histidine phosphatase family protein [Paenibacillus cremeus]|uniref:Histidine phosphatase family protein n=1 Tax=Paenibacillus cremeus TaxID=2163881 RepID=A0A559KHA1_9BACL|nr:histidine phosphatase family protein [Paenibacillus cremeus]TVY11486.1 histidine phosphatase family protein [Paenibacillus cremeus]